MENKIIKTNVTAIHLFTSLNDSKTPYNCHCQYILYCFPHRPRTFFQELFGTKYKHSIEFCSITSQTLGHFASSAVKMESNLQHEDLLIRLRAKLNEERIKLWESPFILPDHSISESLKELSKKFAMELSIPDTLVLAVLHELQLHSIDRSKANSEFKETGLATFRIKATVPGEKPKVLNVKNTLEAVGGDLISSVANELGVNGSRIKLIFNGKVMQPAMTLAEQGFKNGAQIMALVMALNPEEAKKQDLMYLEMKSTRDDAQLLSEYADDFDDEYIKLEDQSGKAVELPPSERRALMVGLALHERGRAAARDKDYPLALVLLLEADRQLSECRSSILSTVDNVAVLQLDVAWCYLCLQAWSALADAAARLARAERALAASYGQDRTRVLQLKGTDGECWPAAWGALADAAARLARAERALAASYGQDRTRVLQLKGTDANERALLLRLYLLQGIVCFHQNKREEARHLLDKAEAELNSLRVDESAVTTLVELGWSAAQARRGLRAAAGDVTRAHHYLADTRAARAAARQQHAAHRDLIALGTCADGSPVNTRLVDALVGMGYSRRLAARALASSSNHVAEAVRMIQEQPELLHVSDMSEEETDSPSSEESLVEPDNKLVGELEAMGYAAEEAKTALKRSHNHISGAVDLLVAGANPGEEAADAANPSTSTDSSKKKDKKRLKEKKKHARDQALSRLKTAIHAEEDDHLDTSLVDEEEFLVQYKSLL
ncbi:NEDD8 ultimate buster 1-like [Choristoneura fumiferana]|uniref:NEDD8 ultimate buster 1-like n=1 Tax=Choristoneura fumiferana TaxID=7141 RepID=UPI003D15762E